MTKRGILMKNKLLSIVPATFVALFLATFLCVSIVAPSSTSATNEPTASAGMDVNLELQPVISIRALDSTGTNGISSVPLSVLPTANGTFTKNSFMLQVDTNNRTGYNLIMSSDYKTDGTTSETTPPTEAEYTNALVNYTTTTSGNTTTTTLNDTIPSLSTNVSEVDFSASNSSYQNKWGVSSSYNETIAGESHTGGDLALYTPVPTHDTTTTLRNDIETAAHNSRTTIGLAANVNTEKVSGAYHNRLVFTAVGNPMPSPTFWEISTMQEMTPAVCATVYTPNNTVSMTDENIITLERYNNGDYTVTSDNSSPLVPERTLLDDRDADGTGTKKSYKVRKLADGNCWMVDNLEYDLLGLYNNGKRGIGSRNDGSIFEMTDENLATGVAGYYDVTTTNAYDYVINQNTKPVTNITRNSYIGNVTGQTEYYYNWTGATAGQGSRASTSGTIDGSICPAGWRIPANYTDTTNQNISWSALTNAYLGITANTNPSTGYQTIEQYPINLYRAGFMSYGSRDYATYGAYWSSTAGGYYGYYLLYDTSAVDPQHDFHKYHGFQLRCVASR